MFWAILRETELLGEVGGQWFEGLELAGWGGLKQLEQAGQELSGGRGDMNFAPENLDFSAQP